MRVPLSREVWDEERTAKADVDVVVRGALGVEGALVRDPGGRPDHAGAADLQDPQGQERQGHHSHGMGDQRLLDDVRSY